VIKRCEWVGTDPIYIRYHDREWGVPVVEDQKLFEFLILEGMQAGLSWLTVLKKRGNFQNAFDGFDAEKMARYDSGRIERLLQNDGIIRNRQKVLAAVANANAYLAARKALGGFSAHLWQFVGGNPLQNTWKDPGQVPTQTPQSLAMSRNLKQLGFRFVGPTICYAFMQAVGMVNDHTVDCFRHRELAETRHHRPID